MRDLQFGVFDHLDRVDRPLHDFYADRLRIAGAIDDAGFDGYFVAEHHSTPLGMAPSPSVYLGAVANATQRLRFGPLVYLLPLYHPIRLAEEIAMLDQLSGGRLEIGVGRGISPIESTLYGRDPSESLARFDEVLAILRLAWSEPQIDFAGTYYQFQKVLVQLTPLQRPHPPMWYGIASPESVGRCVERGFSGVTLSDRDKAIAISHAYLARARAAGRDDLRMAIGRLVVVAGTDDEALRIGRRAYPVWHDSFHFLYHAYGRAPVQGDRPRAFDGMIADGRAIAGSPATVRAALRAQLDETGANYVMGQFTFGDMTVAEATRSIELFAAGVMPNLTPAVETVAR
jgi:alkanesulfonate monooxygenase SsuD/methylene tetrahydromethanopterin reductase-like flavin-dependent oxidoreductase (luciferase family)